MRVAETPLVVITIGLREDWSRKAEGVLREDRRVRGLLDGKTQLNRHFHW